MKRQRKLLAGLGLVSVMAGLVVAAGPIAEAATPTFTVMNTSEAPPDGVYFRSKPATASAIRIAGFGVYRNERVQLQCYAWGGAVGRYNDKLWYYVKNVSRPTAAGRANQGYLNAHYINDGKNANVVDAGVRSCGGSPTPPPQAKSVFYSPIYNDPSPYGASATADLDIPYRAWTSQNCYSSTAAYLAPYGTNKLAGWSVGRLGPIYFLANAGAQRVGSIRTIILFDPGSAKEFEQGCDIRYNINGLLANWLKSNSENRLVILSGEATEDHYLGFFTFRGVHKYYLAGIHGQSFANRALVCDYFDLDHYAVLNTFRSVVKNTPNSCPVAYGVPKPRIINP